MVLKHSVAGLIGLGVAALVVAGSTGPRLSAEPVAVAVQAGQDGAAKPDKIGSAPAYKAPDNWGTNRSPHFTFRFPPEYTTDLDFKTREIVVTRRSDKVKLIRVSFFDSEDPTFRKVADDVPFYKEILGSAVKR